MLIIRFRKPRVLWEHFLPSMGSSTNGVNVFRVLSTVYDAANALNFLVLFQE